MKSERGGAGHDAAMVSMHAQQGRLTEPRTHLESSSRQIFLPNSCPLLNSEQCSRVGTCRQRRHLWALHHVRVVTALLPSMAFRWCRNCSLCPLRSPPELSSHCYLFFARQM